MIQNKKKCYVCIDLKTFFDKKVIDENEYEKYYLLDSRMFGKA